MELSAIASAIYNDVVSGVAGMNNNPAMSLQQLEDEVVEMRETVIKEWYLKNLIKKEDITAAINCIPVDCEDPSKCCSTPSGKSTMHFEIPRLLNDLGDDAIIFVGSTDRQIKYRTYTNVSAFKYYKYKRNNASKPYVYIEKALNSNGMHDGWIFNLPFVKMISVIGIFKDPRELLKFNCCNDVKYLDIGPVSTEVKNRLTKLKLIYYRQYLVAPQPNNMIPK